MVSVAVCAALLIATEAGMLQVAGLVGLAGVAVTAQVRLTVPVKPPSGVTVTVEVLPVLSRRPR